MTRRAALAAVAAGALALLLPARARAGYYRSASVASHGHASAADGGVITNLAASGNVTAAGAASAFGTSTAITGAVFTSSGSVIIRSTTSTAGQALLAIQNQAATELLRVQQNGRLGLGAVPATLIHGSSGTLTWNGTNARIALDNTSVGDHADHATGRLTVFGGNENAIVLRTVGSQAGGGAIQYLKTRSTDGSADVVVSDNDDNILIQGFIADGAAFREHARILSDVDGDAGGSDAPGRLSFWTTPDGSATITERLTIRQSGRVGIGSSSPASLLHVAGGVTLTGSNNDLRCPGCVGAWVVFVGTGTPAIQASYNVASLTDNGPGDYTVNFSTPMSSAYYGVSVSMQHGNTSTACNVNAVEPTASALRLDCRNTADAAADVMKVYATVYGTTATP